MVRKIGGSDIYCELKETNRRMCKVTKNKTKNSDDCEYRKETKKCYIINKKKNKSKNLTQTLFNISCNVKKVTANAKKNWDLAKKKSNYGLSNTNLTQKPFISIKIY